MELLQYIDDNCAISKQLTPAQIQQLPAYGFKSVLNLRSPHEPGVLGNEQQCIEALGLTYRNIPVLLDHLNTTLAKMLLSALETMPKPVLIYCASARRANAVALMEVARRQGLSPDETLALSLNQGFDLASHPDLEQFVYEHVELMRYSLALK